MAAILLFMSLFFLSWRDGEIWVVSSFIFVQQFFILFFLEFLKEQIIYLIPKGLGFFIEYRD